MPRKKLEIQNYVFDKMGFLKDYLQKQAEIRKEFIQEFQEAQMVRFYYTNVDTSVSSYVIIFMKNFAFCIMAYYADANPNPNAWPLRPKYEKVGLMDTRTFHFWRFEKGASDDTIVPPRSFEKIDFAYEIYDENQGASFARIEEYINKVYYVRNKGKWAGLSAICSTFSFTPEEKLSVNENHLINWQDLIISPDNAGGIIHNVNHLIQFWLFMKVRFEQVQIMPMIEEYVAPIYVEPEIEQIKTISNHNVEAFEIYDFRDRRILDYDVEGHIIGFQKVNDLYYYKTSTVYATDTSGNKRVVKASSQRKVVEIPQQYTEKQILMFYDISICMLEGIIYIVQLNLLQQITNPFPGQYVTLMMTFENWIKSKMYIEIEQQNSPEWFSGNFPITEFAHMTFYGGHSFYIPDGYTIDANLTRLVKEAGYLAIKFVTDVFNVKVMYIPMRNIVAYGKWPEYPEPNQQKLIEIVKEQWYSLDSKWRKEQYIINSKEQLIAVGESGTKSAALIPGLTTMTSLLGAFGGMIS